MEYTGERFIPEFTPRENSYEHWHRYLYASQFVENKIVLDIASGEGYGANVLAKTAAKVIGVDIDPEAINFSRSKYRKANLNFILGSVDDVPLKENNSIDVIISFETIEHVGEKEQIKFLQEVKRLLKPDGLFIVSTPDKLYYSELPEFNNGYHIKEFYYDEFLDFLKIHFKYVEDLGQKVYNCSYINHPVQKESDLVEYSIIQTSQGVLPLDEQKINTFIIAICSDSDLKNIKNSILLDLTDNTQKNNTLTPYNAQLFVDYGMGTSEENSIVKPVFGNEKQLVFELDGFKDIKHLRLDPLNEISHIYCSNIKIIDNLGQENLISDLTHNAILKNNNDFYFNTNDPQIQFSINGYHSPVKVIIDLEYKEIGHGIYKQLFFENKAELTELFAKLNERENTLTELSIEIENLRKQNDDISSDYFAQSHILEDLKNELSSKIEYASALESEIYSAKNQIDKLEALSSNYLNELTEKNFELTSKSELLIRKDELIAQREAVEIESKLSIDEKDKLLLFDQSELQAKNEQLKSIYAELEENKKIILKLDAVETELDEKNNLINLIIENNNIKIQEYENKCESLEENARRNETSVESQQYLINEKDSLLAQKQNELNELLVQIESITAELENQKEAVLQNESSLSLIQNSLNEKDFLLAQKQIELNELLVQIESITAELENHKEIIVQNESTISLVQNSLNEKESLLEQKQNELDDLLTRIASYTSEIEYNKDIINKLESASALLYESINEKDSELEQKQIELNQLSGQISTYNSELEIHKEIISQKETALSLIENTLIDKDSILAQKQIELNELLKKISLYTKELDNNRYIINRYEASSIIQREELKKQAALVTGYKSEIYELTESSGRLRSNFDLIQKEIPYLNSQLSDKLNLIERYKEAVSKLKNYVQFRNLKISNLLATIDNNEKTISKLSDDLKQANEGLNDIIYKFNRAEELNKLYQVTLANKNEELFQTKKENKIQTEISSTYEKLLTKRKKDILDLLNIISTIEDENEKTKLSFIELNYKSQVHISELTSEMLSKNRIIEDIEGQNELLLQQLNANAISINNLQSEIENQNLQLEMMNEVVVIKDNIINELNISISERQSELDKYIADTQNLTVELNAIKSQLEYKNREISSLQHEVSELQQLCSNLYNANEELKHENVEKGNALMELNDRLSEQSNSIAAKSDEISNLQILLENMTGSNEIKEEIISLAHSKLSELELEIVNYHQSLDALSTAFEAYRGQATEEKKMILSYFINSLSWKLTKPLRILWNFIFAAKPPRWTK
ncbi:MAG: glycosyltransferase [Ignavibacteria bacterium]|nr:glycosyltransferase [Ignavibacteria bacterium]